MSSCGCWRQKSNFRRADALATEIIPKNIDLVTLGDYDVGKIIFLTTYYTGKFPHEYLPPVFNTCQVSVNFDGKAYKVNLIDTTGQEDYQKMRSLFYHDRDVFLVCYSIGNRASFENVREKWVPEVIQHSPETPILIVAFNTDLRSSSPTTQHLISTAEGLTLASEVKAGFCEVSCKNNIGVKECMEKAVKLVVDSRKNTEDTKNSGCFGFCSKKK